MAISLHVDEEHEVLEVTYTGDIDIQQLCGDVTHLTTLPGYRQTWDGISDFRASKVLYTIDDWETFRDYVAHLENASTGRWAVVLPDSETYATTTMWEVLSEGIHDSLSVCASIEQARDWLYRFKPNKRSNSRYE